MTVSITASTLRFEKCYDTYCENLSFICLSYIISWPPLSNALSFYSIFYLSLSSSSSLLSSLQMKDVQLTEHLKDPTVFQIRHIATHRIYTFQVQNAAMKVEWTQRIKNLLVESLPQLPEKVHWSLCHHELFIIISLSGVSNLGRYLE